MKRLFFSIYALICYAVGLGSLLYFMLFLQNLWVPKTVDVGTAFSIDYGLEVNLAGLILYLTVHSVMARPGFKRWWAHIVPPVLERSTYILISGGTLLLFLLAWQPMTTSVWTIENVYAAVALYALYALGWSMMVLATFNIDHFDFFGVRQVWTWALRRAPRPAAFTARYLYGVTRHPISLGWLIVLYATPQMTAGHLTMALICTLYIAAVTPIEEADLLRELGEPYRAYRKRVRAFLPVPRRPE
ncbi:hypothetical protein BKP64_15570 [Marinobacter salinus]|uniref:Uncharacterized protein n=1 Tax=Marinobacter salinus TaxID=1874317 RepID=A0A1D9GPB0_9GAMM|nr:hypothetical protein [Marinobacter salinus]AOY89472.1 hypothetical protein BKP64_15570 [Marinobacter salinus]